MITKSLYKFPAQLVHILCLPAFFMLFALLYSPQALDTLLHTAENAYSFNVFSFHLSICTAIIIVQLCITRVLILYLFRTRISLNIAGYVAWCLAEIVAMSAFIALYISLMSPGESDWFQFLGTSLKCMLETMAFPYIIIALSYWLSDALNRDFTDEGKRLKFYDNRHLLKFITAASSILCIEAHENYIIIHYVENGAVKSYEVRNSMKNIESMCEQAGFVRAHRSFIVNPSHVTVIRKDRGGFYFAELDSASEREIPVSKKYYEKVASSLL